MKRQQFIQSAAAFALSSSLFSEKDQPLALGFDNFSIRAFGWKAQIGFKETIERMLQWYDKYGINEIYSHLKSGSK